MNGNFSDSRAAESTALHHQLVLHVRLHYPSVPLPPPIPAENDRSHLRPLRIGYPLSSLPRIRTIQNGPQFFQRFITLPRELRDRVYELAFAEAYGTLTHGSPHPKSSFSGFEPLFPNVCLINGQTFCESIAVLVRVKRLVLMGPGAVYTFSSLLELVPDRKAYVAIQDLSIDMGRVVGLPLEAAELDGVPVSAWELLPLCRGLRKLSLVVDAAMILRYVGAFRLDEGYWRWVPYSAERISEALNLDELMDLPHLHVLKLQCVGGRQMADDNGCELQDLFMVLVGWFQAEVARKGGRIHFLVSYAD